MLIELIQEMINTAFTEDPKIFDDKPNLDRYFAVQSFIVMKINQLIGELDIDKLTINEKKLFDYIDNKLNCYPLELYEPTYYLVSENQLLNLKELIKNVST